MKVSEQIIDVLEYLGEKFGVAIDWSSGTILPILQNLGHKYICWEISTSIAWLVIGVMFLIVGFITLKKATVAFKSFIDYDEESVGLYLYCFVSALCLLVGIIMICMQTFDIIKCYTFPEMQAFEYIQRLAARLQQE